MFEINFNPYLKFIYSDDIYKIVLENGVKEIFKAKELLMQPYEFVDYYCFINSGLAKFVTTDFDNKEQVVAILGRGAAYGHNLLFLDTSNNAAYLKAIEPTEIYKIPKDTFFDLIDSSRTFREYVFKGLSYTINMLISNISNISFFTSNKMLYELFLSSIDKNSTSDNIWYGLIYNYNQNELADILGVSRSTLQNSIASLRNEDKIRVVNKKIEVKVQQEMYNQFINQDNEYFIK